MYDFDEKIMQVSDEVKVRLLELIKAIDSLDKEGSDLYNCCHHDKRAQDM